METHATVSSLLREPGASSASLAMRVLLGLVPCVALLGAVALMFGFRLGETEHAAIRSRLARLRVSPPVESTP